MCPQDREPGVEVGDRGGGLAASALLAGLGRGHRVEEGADEQAREREKRKERPALHALTSILTFGQTLCRYPLGFHAASRGWTAPRLSVARAARKAFPGARGVHR